MTKNTCKDCQKPARYLISRPLVIAQIYGIPPVDHYCLKHFKPALEAENLAFPR